MITDQYILPASAFDHLKIIGGESTSEKLISDFQQDVKSLIESDQPVPIPQLAADEMRERKANRPATQEEIYVIRGMAIALGIPKTYLFDDVNFVFCKGPSNEPNTE